MATILQKLAAKAGQADTRALLLAIQECRDTDHGIHGSLHGVGFTTILASDGGESPQAALVLAAGKVREFIPRASGVAFVSPATKQAKEQWDKLWASPLGDLD